MMTVLNSKEEKMGTKKLSNKSEKNELSLQKLEKIEYC